jgi:hypothetical protein
MRKCENLISRIVGGDKATGLFFFVDIYLLVWAGVDKSIQKYAQMC